MAPKPAKPKDAGPTHSLDISAGLHQAKVWWGDYQKEKKRGANIDKASTKGLQPEHEGKAVIDFLHEEGPKILNTAADAVAAAAAAAAAHPTVSGKREAAFLQALCYGHILRDAIGSDKYEHHSPVLRDQRAALLERGGALLDDAAALLAPHRSLTAAALRVQFLERRIALLNREDDGIGSFDILSGRPKPEPSEVPRLRVKLVEDGIEALTGGWEDDRTLVNVRMEEPRFSLDDNTRKAAPKLAARAFAEAFTVVYKVYKALPKEEQAKLAEGLAKVAKPGAAAMSMAKGMALSESNAAERVRACTPAFVGCAAGRGCFEREEGGLVWWCSVLHEITL